MRCAVLALGAVALGASTAVARSPSELPVTITLARLAADRWQVDYAFARPVDGIALGPPIASFRASAWKAITPEVALVSEDGGEALRAQRPIATLRIAIDAYPEFAHEHYVPMIPFSDGGVAFYLGHLTGEAIAAGGRQPLKPRFRLEGMAGERVVAPRRPRGDGAGYAYFGPLRAVASGRARLLVDPGAPAWLRRTFDEVASAVTPVFEARLRHRLPEPPLVMIGAGQLRDHAGYSVKGGAVDGALVMTLRGRDLLDESPEVKRMFQKLVSHEFAHLWQEATMPGGFSDREPWIHEGSAEAMAVAALVRAGLWSAADGERFSADARERCREALGEATLADAVGRGDWAAVYPCGYGMFASREPDVFEVWSALGEASRRRRAPYTQAMLDEVQAAPRKRAAGP